MEEKRIAPRQRVLKAGTIEFGGGLLKRPCQIVWRREKRIGVTFD
jgi:hypothetical protein